MTTQRERIRRITADFTNASSECVKLRALVEELTGALGASQPLLQVAMIEADKRRDGEFLTRLQVTFAANRAALARAKEGSGT